MAILCCNIGYFQLDKKCYKCVLKTQWDAVRLEAIWYINGGHTIIEYMLDLSDKDFL